MGGGPAGLATAIELASAGVRVVVAEARAMAEERYGETLPPGAVARLDRLGLTDVFRADSHLACPGTVVRWGSDRLGHNDFVLDPQGSAWHLDRVRFEAMLRRRAGEVGATVLTSTRFVGFDDAGELIHAALRGPSGRRTIEARWVVDASGSTARTARRRGARRIVTDRLVALVRITDLVGGVLTAQTLVESAPDGWWYAARLPGDRLATVFVTESGNLRGLTAGRWEGWHRALGGTRLLAERLAAVELRTTPDACRLQVRSVAVARLDRVADEHWLAVGDAAAELDPIAGRGMYDALVGGSEAARAVIAGDTAAYEGGWRARFDQHLVERAAWYRLEGRWPAAGFWRSRDNMATLP